LADLTEFRDLYRDYYAFTNREKNVPAQMVREKMRPLAAIVVDSLKRVDIGGMITRDAPVRGGRTVRVNLIRAIFRDNVTRQFSLDDHAPLEILEAGIVRYRRLLWQQRVQLFNPLFWLYHFVGYLAMLPFLIFRKAGYDTEKAEQLTSVRLYVILFQCAFFYFLARWSGILDWIWFDIIAL
jgi:hypothetical protein